jgi:hypothetical protein
MTYRRRLIWLSTRDGGIIAGMTKDRLAGFQQKHIVEAEQRIDRQERRVRELESNGRWIDAERARDLLAVMTKRLELSRSFLRMERAAAARDEARAQD